jgi:hypothetical protein
MRRPLLLSRDAWQRRLLQAADVGASAIHHIHDEADVNRSMGKWERHSAAAHAPARSPGDVISQI